MAKSKIITPEELFSKKSKRRKNDDASILTQRTASERVLYTIMFIIFVIYSISLLYPLFYLLINSFNDSLTYSRNISTGKNVFSFPEVWHFENYVTAMNGMKMVNSVGDPIYLPEMFFNSVWYCGITIFGGVFISSCTGYVIAKYRFKARNFIYALVIFSMTIPIVGTAGATFKLFRQLNLYDSPLYVVVCSLGGFGFNFLIMYGFFNSISWSYAEAVFIDGGGHFSVFFKIMLPQAKMPMLTLAIMAFIGAWNDYMTPLLYLPDFPTIASGLYRIQASFLRSGLRTAYFAGLMLSILPVIILFSCFSDVIMKNFTMGGLKG